MRISEVTERTGVSRELIHHYLRQGLLPRPLTRAQYDENQVRLLQQIKALRDEHHLPLDIIRGLFEFFQRDADRLASLTLADSFANRMARLSESGDALSTRTLSGEELAQEAQVDLPRIDEYREAGLVQPLHDDGPPYYSAYDARVLRVSEQALRLGVPFDSLRTIASFVRVAFELEHVVIMPRLEPDQTVEEFAGNVVVRLELVTSFIQSLLHGLSAHRLRDLAHIGSPATPALEAVVYRPSEGAVRRHELPAAIAEAQRELGARGDDPGCWQHTVALLLHAGRYSEAAFFADQARQRWPESAPLKALHGRALLLSGHREQGEALLASSARPADVALRLVSGVVAAQTAGELDLTTTSSVPGQLDAALAAARDAPLVQRLETRILVGWLWTALPSAFRQPEQGLALLQEAWASLERRTAADFPLPGLQDRLLLNTAWLRYDALGREPNPRSAALLAQREALRTRICRLDPGCHFAQQVFLDEAAGATPSAPPKEES